MQTEGTKLMRYRLAEALRVLAEAIQNGADTEAIREALDSARVALEDIEEEEGVVGE